MSRVFRNVERSRFEIGSAEPVAVAQYELEPGKIVVTHVIVPPEMRGQGVATELAHAVIASAREEGLKVRPLCSFMAAHFEKHPEDCDLLAN